MLGRRPAAAADEVHEAVLGEGAEEAAGVLRLLVVLSHRVRQPGVRVARDVRVGDAREPLEEGTHVGCAERAVDADDERPCVLHGDPERLRRLAREVPPAPVDRGEREPERQVGRDVRGGDDRRLRVQRVEDRLDEQKVDAALCERGDLLRVGLAHLIERDRPEGRVFDLRRDRQRDVERADRAGDEARPIGRARGPLVRGLAREARALAAHLGCEPFEGVVGLADRRRGEGVRRRDVGAGGEVLVVDLGDDLRTGDVQQVGIALDVAPVVTQALAAVVGLGEPLAVDEHAPRPVVDRDPPIHDLS